MFKFISYGLIFLSMSLCLACGGEGKTVKEEVKNDVKESVQKATPSEAAIPYKKYGVSEQSVAGLDKLKVGDMAPNFTNKDQNGDAINLSEKVKEKQTVLVFYRGHWCPFCTKHLAKFADELDALNAKGAEVIAISPESDQYIKETMKKSGLNISYVSDADGAIMESYGVAFDVNKSYNDKFSKWKDGAKISEFNEEGKAVLPVPATFVIGNDQKIKFVHFDPDYTKRSIVDDIIKIL